VDDAAAVDAKTRPQAAWKTAAAAFAVSHIAHRHFRFQESAMSQALVETTFERHYSVEELCALWGMSDDFIRRLFLHEPGRSASLCDLLARESTPDDVTGEVLELVTAPVEQRERNDPGLI
jgi:hypothetical protein